MINILISQCYYLKKCKKSDAGAMKCKSLEKVSDSVWVSFESCDYREHIKRGMNE